MDTVKSLRLPEDLLRSVRYLARRERLDESTAIRQLIALGSAEYAVRLYREGKITLNEAAELASATPREMIEILLDHGVRGNVTVSQARKALQYVLAAQGSRDETIYADCRLDAATHIATSSKSTLRSVSSRPVSSHPSAALRVCGG